MNENGTVAAGLDTHRDTHALCVIDRVGRVLRTGTYSADAAGYDEIASAIGEPGDCAAVGIEGTGSYGAGVARRLAELGYDVVEVVRPRREKRMAGRDKNDPADAERAARDALAGRASGAPKAGSGWVEALRFRMVARETAVGESTRAANSVHALVVTAPAPVRERLAGMRTPTLMKELSRRRSARDELERSLWDSLRSLALAWRAAKEAAAEQEAAMRFHPGGERAGAARRERLRRHKRRQARHSRGRQPGEGVGGGRVRIALRGVADRSVQRQGQALPPEPRRRPTGEPRAPHHRPPAHEARRPHEGLCRKAHQGRQEPTRDRARPRPLHRPRSLSGHHAPDEREPGFQ